MLSFVLHLLLKQHISESYSQDESKVEPTPTYILREYRRILKNSLVSSLIK
ncbi:MAG: palindromic element RPE3 domain-containing protein [Rickettsia endosymbiont of Ixodes persulcatus]|nr:palindromic element RPE3 domain-containing protein [Rickettsia endosymbiont of Ixodes persulcatus]MCZ6901347.1 palindromic element RPE3 domain-containing protein [Rickettsia endosymbiont of Ixodes persulcatus]MCZ6903281.1 palindromic element RPE3 domain-containing protein [Rickettsia endosymbiont of Ixodes persulcatus]MCZ6908880.1 palindromic element RPE3 domain-containing protein [Rickettsia endosymbiont of Ixodes persulcatus]MCZ6910706.1 palindromic element RPE3 domain-containing protein [